MYSTGLSAQNGFFIVALHVPWCRHLDALPDVKPQQYADNLKCSAERPRALFESARFTAQYVRSVGQDVSPGKCVLLSTSKSVRRAVKLLDVAGDGGFWKVKLDVSDLGGHLDLTFRARAGTLFNRVREATSGVASGGLPLGFQVKLGLVRGKYLPAGLHAAELLTSPPLRLALTGSRILRLSLLRSWCNLILQMLSFVRLGCPFSVGLVILSSLRISFWASLVLLPQETCLDLPRITGRDLQEVARAKKSTAGGLDGWAWNEIKALPLPWFSGLAILLELVETSGVWPQGLLDAFFAIILKPGGDSTPQVNGPSVCSQLGTGCGLPFGLDICGSGLRGGCLKRCIVLVLVYPRWRPGSLLLWILRRFFLGLVVISCMLWSLMSLSPLILLIGLFWIVHWVVSGYLTGFVRFIFFS